MTFEQAKKWLAESGGTWRKEASDAGCDVFATIGPSAGRGRAATVSEEDFRAAFVVAVENLQDQRE